MDPALATALEARPYPPLPLAPETREARDEHLDQVRHLLPVPVPIAEVEEHVIEIPARDGYLIPTVLYKPSTGTPGGPLIILFHEGGFILGNRKDEESNARMFSRDFNAVCLNPEYRLAPEHPLPTGVLDSMDVLKWAAANASQSGANPTKGFILGGSSAGGNIASVLVHLSRQEDIQPPVTGQWLSVPFIMPLELVPEQYRQDYSSVWMNRTDPVLPALSDGQNNWNSDGFVKAIANGDVDSPLFSPLSKQWYPKGVSTQKAGSPFPKAFFQVCGLDPLRDHGLVYEKVLSREWNAPTKLIKYEGFCHMFWTNWPAMERSKDYWRDLEGGMKWLLEQ